MLRIEMNQPAFIPTNKLEEILVAACTEPSARPEFYQLLLESDLFLLTPDSPAQEGRRTLETEEKISFVHLQNANGPFLPIFTSRERLQEIVDQIGQSYGFLALRGKDLFPLLAQHPPVALLNPGLAYGKELTTEEIRRIADGSIVKNEQRVIQNETKILIGQPAKYPTDLVAALQKLFAKNELVQAAYLGWIHDPSSGEPPHLIVGIECNGNMQKISQEAGITSQGLLGEGEFVDFIQVGGGKGSLDSYFKKQTKPFYQKTEKPFWKVW